MKPILTARNRALAGATTVALGLVQLAALPAIAALGPAGAARYGSVHLHAPKAGATYKGVTVEGGDLTVNVADSQTVQIISFRFDCVGAITGRTGLTDITIKKTRKVYKFALHAHASIEYSDPDMQHSENGAVIVWGKFAPNAKSAKGHVRVNSSRCGDTGNIDWSARIG